jgi:OOP family OmpA-OmpF porin
MEDTMKSKSLFPRRNAAASIRAAALAAVLGLISLVPALAQDAGGTTLLRGRNVTESNLLDALTPPPAAIVTRGLRVRPSGSTAPVAPSRPSASLLITFETNSSELTSEARQQLDVVGAALKNERLVEYTFNVEGHADPRGNADSNMILSRQRAESVRSYLIANHAIGAQRLIAEGKGDLELLNRAYPAAPENRRVTIVTNMP